MNGELGMTERGLFKNGNVVCSDIDQQTEVHIT